MSFTEDKYDSITLDELYDACIDEDKPLKAMVDRISLFAHHRQVKESRNQVHASNLLGISRTTYRRIIQRTAKIKIFTLLKLKKGN